jgi:hypothetical protein
MIILPIVLRNIKGRLRCGVYEQKEAEQAEMVVLVYSSWLFGRVEQRVTTGTDRFAYKLARTEVSSLRLQRTLLPMLW